MTHPHQNDSDKHNAAVQVLLPQIVRANPDEVQQWIIMESLFIGIGLTHNRSRREVAEVLEMMADRILKGEREVGRW